MMLYLVYAAVSMAALYVDVWSAPVERQMLSTRGHHEDLGGKALTQAVTLSSGLTVRIADGPAASQLRAWAGAISAAGGATHQDAVMRERQVVNQVERGLWPAAAYEEYQHLAAGSGQVDSGRLLLQYGMTPAVLQAFSGQGEAPLHAAAAQGNLEAVSALLTSGVWVDTPLPDGTTALHAASVAGAAEVVGLLLSEGADTASTAANGVTALQAAAMAGHVTVVEALLKAGSDVNGRHQFAGNTALHFAAEMGAAEAITALCAAGADVEAATTSFGGTPLHTAVDSNMAASIQALLSPPCAANPDALMSGDTVPLYTAALNGFVEVTRALLAGGANASYCMPCKAYQGTADLVPASGPTQMAGWMPNAEPGNGATPLHAAAEQGHEGVVKELLSAGADLDSSAMGVTPLILAVQYNRPGVTRLLLKAGAHLEARSTIDGATAVYTAAGYGRTNILALLLSAGALPNTRQLRSGATPLIYAAAGGHQQSVALLLEGAPGGAGPADPDLKADDGFAALHVAAQQGHTELCRQLLAAGADPSVQGPEGLTPLHLASQHDRARAVAVLLDGGARVDARTEPGGATPLSLAVLAGAAASASLLVSWGADVNAQVALEAGGDTVLIQAVKRGDAVLPSLLLSAGADPDMRGAPGTGPPPIVVGVMSGHAGVVQALLQHGASCSIMVQTRTSNQEMSLVDVARARRDFKMLQVLVSFPECDMSVQPQANVPDAEREL